MPKKNKEKDIEEELTAPEKVLPKGVEPGAPLTAELLKSINDGLDDNDIKKILGLLNKNRESDKMKELKDADPLYGERTRRFCMEFSFYYETHDKDGNDTSNGLNKNTWAAVKFRQFNELFEKYHARLAVGMLHDRDVLVDKQGNQKYHDDGSIAYKEPHIHVVVEFKHAKTWTSVYRNFGLSRYDNLIVPREPSQAYRYLFHLSEGAIAKNKTIYPLNDKERLYFYQAEGETPLRLSDIFTPTKREMVDIIRKNFRVYDIKISDLIADDDDDLKYFNELDAEIKQKVLLGELTEKEAPTYISKVMHSQGKFDKFADFWDKTRQAEYKKADEAYVANRANYCLGFVKEKMEGMIYSPFDNPDERNLDTIYVTGQGGSGKTSLANELCKLGDYLGRGYNKVAPAGKGKTYDFAGQYRGEEATLVDEVTPWTMGLTEFLSIFDPHNYNNVNSRNVDKSWYAHRAVITSSIGMDYFNAQIVVKDGGKNDKHNQYLDANGLPDYSKKLFTDRKYQVARRVKYIVEVKPLASDDGKKPVDYYLYALMNVDSSTSVHVYIDKIHCTNVINDRSMKATGRKINDYILQIDEGKFKPFNELKWDKNKVILPAHCFMYYSKNYAINRYFFEEIADQNENPTLPDVLPFAEALKRQKNGTEEVPKKNPFEDFDDNVVDILTRKSNKSDEKEDENSPMKLPENPFSGQDEPF